MLKAQETPRGMRCLISFIGDRNAGKSSLINAICGQDVAIVSDVAGTTTDAVAKPYELLPFGPVTFYDTAGVDDEGGLGLKRIEATKKIVQRSDVVVWVAGEKGIDKKEFLKNIIDMKIPLLVVFNKSDISEIKKADIDFCKVSHIKYFAVSAKNGTNINELKALIIDIIPKELKEEPLLAGDLFKEKDTVVMVVPIDISAPKGRLILPQVQMLREILDSNAKAIVTKESDLEDVLANLKKEPSLVITDSQVVLNVAKIIPQHIPLTTFSILFARYKGNLKLFVDGARKIDALNDGAKIMIAEACSHHVQCDDIGRVKIPNLLKKYTNKNFEFNFYSGHDFPDDLENFDLVIHCGACMFNRQEMINRVKECVRRGVNITNYGVAISKMQGVLDRVIELFNL